MIRDFKPLAVALLAALALPVAAQTFPNKPLRLVVGFPPGGGSDAIARALADRLGTQLGQQIVVDNKPGANGNIGAEYAAKLPADGHHLLLISLSQAINVSLYTKLNYDLAKDFASVAMIGAVPNTVVIHPSLGVNDVKSLIAVAKKDPGKISYASSGLGSPEHLAGEMFKSAAGVDMVHVPYKGSGQSIIDLAAGHVTVGFNTLPSVITQVKSGKVKILAVTTPKRSGANPDVPTVAEAGLPNFSIATWYALLAPAGTPPDIVNRLNDEVGKALSNAEMKERLAVFGADTYPPAPPVEVSAFIRSETEKFRKIVQQLGIQLN